MSSKKAYKHADSEIGTIRKSWSGKMSIALVYPNRYSIGMSNLGFLSIYQLLNNFKDVVCERAFLPEQKTGGKVDETEKIITIESGRLLDDFDIVAFSISFENDFPNMLTIIQNSGFPLQSYARGGTHPLLIAGGVACFLNPEPVAEFIDCFLIGEGESLFDPFFKHLDLTLNKETCLLNIAQHVPGAYVPAFYKPEYHQDSSLKSFEMIEDVPKKVKRVYLSDLSDVPTFSTVVSPEAAFDASWLIEVSRGCPHGCRFCSAGYVYRPPRFRDTEFLQHCFVKGSNVSTKIGLVGTAISDHPDIGKICTGFENKDVRFSFSSLRADALSEEHIQVLKTSSVKTATIAPDAGSERMRSVINKGITKEHVLEATRRLVEADIPNLKIYLMVGLPGETDVDIEETICFCKDIKEVFLEASRAKGHIGHITVSLNPFVPKPFTPFQWAPMEKVSTLKKKINKIKNGLRRVSNMSINADSPREAYIQALFSRGDRRLSTLLTEAVENNWSWSDIYKQSSSYTDFYVHRERPFSELFPWDFIDHGVRKSFLENEYKRALNDKTSPPCPITNCSLCGVCK